MQENKKCCSPSNSGVDDLEVQELNQSKPIDLELDLEFLRVESGDFFMGAEDEEVNPDEGESPTHKEAVKAFEVSSTTVTNADFQKFVEATAYKTEAERYGNSFVFQGQLPKSKLRKLKGQSVPQVGWWYMVPEASWKRPSGPGSNIFKILDHPVVHVSYNDALAFCSWVGVRLLTEIEWEYSARAGVTTRFPWGDELTVKGRFLSNVWEGNFPHENEAKEFKFTAPAKSYEPNPWGLYNVCGNVWEWCQDWYAKDFSSKGITNQRVIRGGSFLCHKSYCNRYRLSARSSNEPNSSSSNMGFRVAKDI